MGIWRRLWIVGGIALLSGCGVQRTMLIQSDPPGAVVDLNGEEIGRTPVQHDFLWYGQYDVTLHKQGYDTIITTTDVKAPWWQWIPIDLVAELMPFRPEDRQLFTYDLKPATTRPVDRDPILQRATEMQVQLETTQVEEPTTREAKVKAPKKGSTKKAATTHSGTNKLSME